MAETLSTQQMLSLAVAAGAITLWSLTRVPGIETNYWKSNYPIVGVQKQWLGWMRATLRSVTLSKVWALEGYEKYSRLNSPFVIPCLDRGPVVVVPPKQLKKLYNQPVEDLDITQTQNETIQTKYTVWDQDVIQNHFQIDVIRHQMTRNLAHLTPLIAHELEDGFNEWWGSDFTEWRELRIWDSCLKLIAGASNGAFCGPPLCRDPAFLESLRDHAMATFVGAMIINAMPAFFSPVVGGLVKLYCEYRFRKAAKICLPYIIQRLENTRELKSNPSHDWEAPVDGLQWIIDESYATQNPAQLDPIRVCRRLLYVNDISLHSTSYTIQNVILDLFNHDESSGILEALRMEAATVLHEAGGSWTREAVQKLKLIDATIRESMRMTPFASVGLPRRVIKKEGLTMSSPHGDLHIPFGTVVAVPMDPIHRDETIYPDPNTFNPYRFTGHHGPAGIFDQIDAQKKGDDQDSTNELPAKGNITSVKSSVTLDDAFLGFGFGRHACPGRFFALNEMKIFLAHMVLNYDVECLDRRPELTNVIWLKVPYNDGRVRVRRKKDAWK